jgi:hypothetical protein
MAVMGKMARTEIHWQASGRTFSGNFLIAERM